MWFGICDAQLSGRNKGADKVAIEADRVSLFKVVNGQEISLGKSQKIQVKPL